MFRKIESMFYTQFTVMTNERAMLFYRGRLIRILRAGQVRVFDPFGRYAIEYFSLEPQAPLQTMGNQLSSQIGVSSRFRQRLIELQAKPKQHKAPRLKRVSRRESRIGRWKDMGGLKPL